MPRALPVRAGFGPTFPELVAGLPRPLRTLIWALVAALGLLACWWVILGRGRPLERIVIERPVEFNIAVTPPLRRAAPAGDEVLRLTTRGQSLTVSPLALPASHGGVSLLLPVYASLLTDRMQRTVPGFVLRGEGRVSINKTSGYEIVYMSRGADGERRYARRLLVLPDENTRRGVEMTVVADASPSVVNPDMVGRTNPLKSSLQSFRFGARTP